jgi:glutathione S-transferase
MLLSLALAAFQPLAGCAACAAFAALAFGLRWIDCGKEADELKKRVKRLEESRPEAAAPDPWRKR